MRIHALVVACLLAASSQQTQDTGPVRVTGSDPYDVDADRDGKACEWS
jgi:hypothetical protein